MVKKKQASEILDLTASNSDYAVFLPSISSIYVKIQSQRLLGKRPALPPGMNRSWDDLDFLCRNGDLFTYKIGRAHV